MKLGSPGNSFRVINEISWGVYSKELLSLKKQSLMQKSREITKYWFLRFLFFGYLLLLRSKQFLGLSVRQEDLEDFELN